MTTLFSVAIEIYLSKRELNRINLVAHCVTADTLFLQELPEHKGILVYILIANLINTILNEIPVIELAVQNGGDRKSAAIASVMVFVFVTVIIFGGLFIINLIYSLIRHRKKDKTIEILLLVGQAIGALCYFYGDNVAQIFIDYGPELSCGPDCISNNNIAATISSGFALLLFIEYPTCLHRIAKLHGLRETNTGWFSASGMIALFIKLDALFNTVVIATADIDDFCNEVAVAINVSFLVICVLTGIVLMAVNSVYAAHQLQTSDQKQYTWIAYLALGALLPARASEQGNVIGSVRIYLSESAVALSM